MRIRRVKLVKEAGGILLLACGWLFWRVLTTSVLSEWSREARGMMLLIGGILYMIAGSAAIHSIARRFGEQDQSGLINSEQGK